MSRIVCTLHECCFDDQIKEDGVGEACRAHRKMRNAYTFLVVKREGNRPWGRTGCRYVGV
jgi:hypothetical protein